MQPAEIYIHLQDLPEKEKARFENMAKQAKARMRGKEGDKYKLDTFGNSLAVSQTSYCILLTFTSAKFLVTLQRTGDVNSRLCK